MEGVTDPCFRDLVLATNPAAVLGGAFTESVRVVDQPIPAWSLAARLGPCLHVQPVGLQLMGSDERAMAASARNAVAAGAPLVDLNFGCPAKGALRGCAGSALLDDPARLERLVRCVVESVAPRPVSAKIRAGGEDDARLEELVQAAEAGGASLLTVHCRTRREGYADCADWERLRRAVRAVRLPVCGNGGVRTHADLVRLRAETGCAFTMVGRAALGDPWIFQGRRAAASEAARFLCDYAAALGERGGGPRGMSTRGAAGRVKQLLHHWVAGGLLSGEDERRRWLASAPHELLARLESIAGEREARDAS
jgi:tRNA-dihydrouridine synthase C